MKYKISILVAILIVLTIVVLISVDSRVDSVEEKTVENKSQESISDFEWEESYAVAKKKKKKENKPLFVMMTATWCGWCKRLEKETLSNSTVRESLKPFIAVKVYENKKINRKLGYQGYPTLAFIDSDENVFHNIVGYRDVNSFISEVDLARKQIGLKATAQ
ncbi:MAG: thioredoxin family protein [Deltaproteobacteria bacterium]|nr:thioredoxin family protein [Deltaproteobacteria bacterium]